MNIMNILLVGGLNVNPERFLPLIAEHNVFGIWESTPEWDVSVRAGGPYKEIQTITVKEIAKYKIDIVWSLLSPWDGLHTTREIIELYPGLPVIRQTQGASTPWWHTPTASHPRSTTHGNYKFGELKAVLEQCAGLMFVSERYRQSLIDQGAEIENVPYIISNGMAYNADIIQNNPLTNQIQKLSDQDMQPHIALIGRAKHDLTPFINNKIHVHYHSTSSVKRGKYVHREPYLGDIKFIRKRPVNITDIFKMKRAWWPATFTKYSAGIMHLFDPNGIDVFNGVDINVPGRVNTYMMHGLPPIITNRESSIQDFLAGTDCAIEFYSPEDLADKLWDLDFLQDKQRAVRKHRYRFSMQYELEHNVLPFMGAFL